MSEPTPLPQYQIDQIIAMIRTSLAEIVPRQQLIDSVCTSIRAELNSPTNASRFESVLEKYYKSNTELTAKLETFHGTILTNQSQIAILLKQIVDSTKADDDDVDHSCPNTERINKIYDMIDEILNGTEYKGKQQVRDLLESGIARTLRNAVITYAMVTAIIAGIIGIIGYFALAANTTKTIQTEIKKLKKEAVHDSTQFQP